MNEYDYELKPTTRVLFYLKSLQLYLLTNMEGEVNQRFPVFLINKSGTKELGGCLLGSMYAHSPYMFMDAEPVNCTYGELNPSYFEKHI